ncbi:DUF4013 domain-containing protein [Halomicroarcula sp. GCM10025709]|uniref:DUF4013 domain-containing protein n=1 Tax=Haloarcula TaxID=2237 RepID=UPI0024C26F51|nr:DUF4013 domain-containing protein [Halomicroarcula sp. YJ-61-S]
MFTEALNYPRESDDVLKTVLIGGLLLFFSFLLVPLFVVVGYVLRVLRSVMDGDEELPVFDEWGELAIDGLKASIIGFVYSLVPTLIAIVAVFGGILSLGLGNGSAGSGLVASLIALVATLAIVVVSLAIAYVLPAALVAYARTDSMSAAFSLGEIRRMAFSRTYATGWAVAFGISFLGGIVVGALNAIVIGVVLAPFVTFYANVAGTHAIATAVREMPVVEESPDAPAGQPMA